MKQRKHSVPFGQAAVEDEAVSRRRRYSSLLRWRDFLYASVIEVWCHICWFQRKTKCVYAEGLLGNIMQEIRLRDLISTFKKKFKGPVKAVSGHKITPNHFKTTYRSVLTFEEKKQSITHLFKTFSGKKGRKIRSTKRFKTSAILNARFRESYFKLNVNGRAVTSQTDKQPNVEVGSV